MTPEQQAAYVMAQVICAYAKIEGMKVANRDRQQRGDPQAYSEEAFGNVATGYGLEHNQVIAFFYGRQPL